VIIIKHFQKVSFYSNNLNEKWNGKVGRGTTIVLYHCADDDAKIDTTGGGKKQKQWFVIIWIVLHFFTGLLKYNMPMTDHKLCKTASACYTSINL